ncbi:MAG TPA: DUF5652 family protein [Candidatus Saccharimonadales bacterium]|nr:DUF5652 family protein [Candidatus Saccharimonadales bacterium]
MWPKDPGSRLQDKDTEIEQLKEKLADIKASRRRKLPRPLRRLLIALVIWETAWKGAALWRAARRGQIGWFIAILFSNTAGALPITYLMRGEDNREPESNP